MASPDQKTSIVLTGGQDESRFEEFVGPVATQGAALPLRSSRNTRLSQIPGTCVRAPNASLGYAAPSPIHSVVSSSTGRNVLAFHRLGRTVGQVLDSAGTSSGVGAGPLGGEGGLDFDLDQEAYIPTRITGAGALASSYSAIPPATAYDYTSGLTWHATASRNLDDETLIDFSVQVVDSEGGAIVKPQVIAQTTAPAASASWASDPNAMQWLWCGLTTHGSSGPRLWLLERADLNSARLWVYSLQISGNGLVASGAVVTGIDSNIPGAIAATDIGVGQAVAVRSGEIMAYATPDTTYGGYAFFAHRQVGGNDAWVHRIDVATLAVTSVELTGVVDGLALGETLDISFSRRTTGEYEIGFASLPAGNATIEMRTINPASMAVVASASVAVPAEAGISASGTQYPRVATEFLGTLADGNHLYAAIGFLDPDPGTPGLARTVFARLSLDGTPAGTYERLMHRVYPISRGATLRFSQTEFYPVWELVSAHVAEDPAPSEFGYVSEPAIHLYLQAAPSQLAPVARYGVVRAVLGPARVTTPWSASSSMTTYGGKVRTAYVKDEIGYTGVPQLPTRWVEVDFNPHQTTVVYDRDGTSIIAGALVAQWDGYAVSEFGPTLHRPDWLIAEGSTSGSPLDWPVGSYQIGAFYSWTDAAGIEHRSGSIVTTLAIAAGNKSVTVGAPLPMSMRTDRTVEPIELNVYVSSANGANLYRAPVRAYVNAAAGTYEATLTEPGDSTCQILYSRGAAPEQQMPQAPPPMLDMAIIGDRCWGLDAEVRSRVVYSKRRASGHGFEFHPAYEVLLPSGSGRAVAVREWQGSAVVFTEYGIYQISGDGPDNLIGNPSGSSFSKPIQLAHIGARSKESVVSTPVGIFFQRDDDVMLFAGGSPTVIAGYQPENAITGAWHIRDAQEVVFFDGSAEQRIYNYETSSWTTWSLVEGTALEHVHPLGYDLSKAIVRSSGETPSVYTVESASLSQTSAMSWETGWILLAGDFQDRILLRHVLLSARRAGAHGVTVEIFTNHETTASTTREWTAAEIGALPTASRYTLRVQPARQDTTAVKIRITETEVGVDREGMQPVALTLVYALDAQQNDGGLLPEGAYK